MITKTVWILFLVTGGAVDGTTSPVNRMPLTRFWTQQECEQRRAKYDNDDGRAKLKELAGGEPYVLACFPQEVATAP